MFRLIPCDGDLVVKEEKKLEMQDMILRIEVVCFSSTTFFFLDRSDIPIKQTSHLSIFVGKRLKRSVTNNGYDN